MQKVGEEVMALGQLQGSSVGFSIAILRLKCAWVVLYDKIGGGLPHPTAAKLKLGGVAPSVFFPTLCSATS